MAELLTGPTEPETQKLGDETLLNVFASARGLADPNPLYRTLRDEVPRLISGFGGTVFTRYDDCREILRDNRFGNGSEGPGPNQSFGSGNPETIAFRKEMEERRKDRPQSMLGLDPPDHTRQRSLVSRAFTPRRVEGLRDRIAVLVDERLDELAESSTADAMTMLAEPLPGFGDLRDAGCAGDRLA